MTAVPNGVSFHSRGVFGGYRVRMWGEEIGAVAKTARGTWEACHLVRDSRANQFHPIPGEDRTRAEASTRLVRIAGWRV